MSLIPRDLFDDFYHPYDLGLFPRSLVQLERNLPQLAVPTVQNNRYNVNLDVRHFDPSEISVKVEDNSIKVSGKREKKSEDGKHYEFREYQQHFTVPDNVNVEELKSQLDQKGILRIEAPLKGQLGDKARHIPIEYVKK